MSKVSDDDKAGDDDKGGVAVAEAEPGSDGTDSEPGPAKKFEYFEHHPLLMNFPPATDADVESMKIDVLRQGVVNSLVLWRGPRSRVFVIDGRTRQEGAARAYEERIRDGKDPVADNGVDLQPTVTWFDGDSDAVLEFIKTSNVRKHYTQSQRAAMGTKVYYAEYKKRHGNRLPDPAKEVAQEGSNTSEELGRIWNCNPYYFRICRQLYREATELLDAVFIGTLPCVKAMAQLQAKRTAPPDGEAPGDDAPPPPAGDSVKDGNGDAVSERWEDTFRSRSAVKLVCKEFDALLDKVETLSKAPGGGWFDVDQVARAVKAVVSGLRRSQAHEVCSNCRGGGKTGAHDCKKCGGRGYACKASVDAQKRGMVYVPGKGEVGPDGGDDKKE